jgi:hypothetical protein
MSQIRFPDSGASNKLVKVTSPCISNHPFDKFPDPLTQWKAALLHIYGTKTNDWTRVKQDFSNKEAMN